MPMVSWATRSPDHVWLPWVMSGIIVRANLPGVASVEMTLETLSLILSGCARG